MPALVDISEPAYAWQAFDYHWYRATFRVPAGDCADLAFLGLHQAMFGTDVWLNGEHVGGDIACYTSQEYDVRQAIKFDSENELLVRVGARHTLPPESAVGKDQERSEFIPGIWGDVALVLSGNPRVKLVQVIPHLEISTAEARITLENFSTNGRPVHMSTRVVEKHSGRQVSKEIFSTPLASSRPEVKETVFHPIDHLRPWSPDDPFLYELVTMIRRDDQIIDELRTTFGMREFKIIGADFFLNGNRIFLKGGNIAFHRFLSDAERGELPWDGRWIKRLLIDIPKAHHFNFFRNHIGQMYNLWYDIADEHGMLLQNEWQFWTTTGTKEQITKEFTRWLQDNWNHPSIIIWDALNESSDKMVQEEIVPEMKKLDPTRPWESVDFIEQHPYIYSLGPALNDRTFGFTQSLHDIENFSTPSVLNEFLWWWLNSEGNPTSLMDGVVERWLGRSYSREDLLAHQSFLAQELVELFRRMRADAIQPFVYLNNNAGPTAHWFLGDIKELRPKPILATLKNAFAPFGISIELWDRHFFSGERRPINLFVFNDEPLQKHGVVRYGVVNDRHHWLSSHVETVRVEGGGCVVLSVTIDFPATEGTYYVMAELQDQKNIETLAFSRKVAHVFDQPSVLAKLRNKRVVVFDQRKETNTFLATQNLTFEDFEKAVLNKQDILIVTEGMVRDRRYQKRLHEISRFIRSGSLLIVTEPEVDVDDRETIEVLNDWKIEIEKRTDADKGGYDSYVFAEDESHPLWRGISRDHLKMFNGGMGGEIISQHNVTPLSSHRVLARCGLYLNVHAAVEADYGRGKIIITRLQLRGRLVQSENPELLYSRRVDPVAQQYLLNVLSYAIGK